MVASRGYDTSGLGSEIPLGNGVIGVAAAQRTPIRISHFTAEYNYGRAIREEIRASGLAEQLESEIPLPGLTAPRSQLAVPIVVTDQVVGVLYAESAEDRRFSFEHEDLLVALAAQLGASIALLRLAAESHESSPSEPAPPGPPPGGAPVRLIDGLSEHSSRERHSNFRRSAYFATWLSGNASNAGSNSETTLCDSVILLVSMSVAHKVPRRIRLRVIATSCAELGREARITHSHL